MLKKHLIANTKPQAEAENILRWREYRVTVLGDRLFRLEYSENRSFRDEATQAIWYRNTPKQYFSFSQGQDIAIVDTGACKLVLKKDVGQVCVELDGKEILLNNQGNLMGTYRTLDGYDGNVYRHKNETPKKIKLGFGVCSKTGVAVIDDSASLTLGEDGEVKNEKADGKDLYIFAYGKNYREAVQALYALTGETPLIPRFALGNWWSRYYAYTDEGYLRLLNEFLERDIPLSVATVDMDWHYSMDVNRQMGITEKGLLDEKYIDAGNNIGWTGYTWNTELFPNYKEFLKKVGEMGLKITLNLHPAQGIRFWEEQYEAMAKAVGMDASTKERILFDFSDTNFINAYFDILHHPFEKDGVDFWWMDWQQGKINWHGKSSDVEEDRYDPLWALNHYHYLDNGRDKQTPLTLSRYAGVGSHRYPLGFSGDTYITWKTLAYLPYFTATASNVGYTWWSHDIGGHQQGEKSDELYVRHLQYGVFSPINRLHCTSAETMTKEPWAHLNGAGQIAENFLRLRHRFVPYLYTASYRNQTEGRALIEPLYYEWKSDAAYTYDTEYLFGSELLVAPVTSKAYPDGYARVRAWLPEGKWTDIFTGDEYEIGFGGKEITLLRSLDSIPVLAKAGGILPLAEGKGNGCPNPKNLEVWSYLGDGEYTLYEDGKEEGKGGVLFTNFKAEYTETDGVCTQSLTVFAKGDSEVIPAERNLLVRFKNIPNAEIKTFVDGAQVETEKLYLDCAAARIVSFECGKTYRVEAKFKKENRLEGWKRRATKLLTLAEGNNVEKYAFYENLTAAQTEEEFIDLIDTCALPEIIKLRIKESIR